MSENLIKATAAMIHETVETERDAALEREKSLREDLADLREKLDAATAELETERAAKKEAREAAAADVSRLETEIETVSILLGEAQTAGADREKDLRQELAHLCAKLDQATIELETERAAKKEAREAMAADVARLEKEIASTSTLLGDTETTGAEREKSLREDLTDLRKKLDAASAELETERAGEKEAREAAAGDVSRLETEIEAISTMLGDAETAGADREKDLRQELVRLKGDLTTAREDLDARLKAEAQDRSEGFKQIDTLKSTIGELDARLAEERAEAAGVIGKIAAELKGVSKDHLFASVITGEIGVLKAALNQFCIETGQKRPKQLSAVGKGTPVVIQKYAEEILR